mmetsp:Transcript_61083/g.74875  ORF Transcript_61083/g.74875 Transcript_61083/m.74875 type:complete len:635 (+) Transcript_61083:29-1933(+)
MDDNKTNSTGLGENTALNDDVKSENKDKSTEEEEKIPDYGGTKRLAREYAKGLGCYLFLGYLASLLNGCTTPMFALIFRELIRVLAESIDETTLQSNFQRDSLQVMIYFIAMGVGAFVFTLLQYYFWSVYGIKVAINVRKDYFEAILAQEMAYHDKRTSGVINAELVTECEAIEMGVGQKVGVAMQHFGEFLVGAILAFYYSWRITLVLTSTIPVLVMIGVIQGVLIYRTGSDADPFAKSGGFSQEVLTNIRNVQAFPYLMKQKFNEYVELVIAAAPISRRKEIIAGVAIGAMMMGIVGVMYGVGLFAGSRFVDAGTVSQDDFFGAFFAYMVAGMGLGSMASVGSDITKAKQAANKFYHIKERQPDIKKSVLSDDKLIRSGTLKGEIEFKDVSFSYPTAPDKIILKNVSFKVNAGESLALVGPSGSGKSTIVALIERYYDPNYGQILIDNVPIENYDINWLRNQVGLVSQNPLLFDASVKENIRGGASEIEVSDDDIINYATIANANDFIVKLDKGYDTRVGELGGRLSGGQKQRIVIARAILNKPKILLLDEATSALDSKNEKDVQIALDKINKLNAQTTISIAHRLSTIKDHTNILVLVNGKVNEYGNHEQLMNNGGVYSALVTAQQLGSNL